MIVENKSYLKKEYRQRSMENSSKYNYTGVSNNKMKNNNIDNSL